MATTNIKRQVADLLADYIGTQIAALAGKVHSTAPGPEETAGFPCATVLPGPVSFEPHDPIERGTSVDEIQDERVILDVGDFTGEYEIRVYAKSVAQREALEQAVTDLFLARLTGGLLVLTLSGVTLRGEVQETTFPVGFMLDRGEWQEEYAWENRRFAFIDVRVEFPALVLQDAYTIDDLQQAISTDDPAYLDIETVSVDEDGNLT